jgi:hypothetical protein
MYCEVYKCPTVTVGVDVMSKQEKASWSLLVSNLAIGVWYFSMLFGLGTDLAAQVGAMVGLFIKLTVVSIVLAVAGEIVMYALSGNSKDTVEEDERDQLISLKARRNGYFVLVSAVILLMAAPVVTIALTLRIPPTAPDFATAFLQQAGQAVFMANLLLLALMLAEVVIQGSRVFYYRRG